MEKMHSREDVLKQDPDYAIPFDSASCQQNVFEIEARTRAANKISEIIDAEFLNEINSKKSEIYRIYKNLNKACKMLHYLRFAIITDFYNQENNCDNEVNSLKQFRLHPTVINTSSKSPANTSETNCFNDFVEEKGHLKRKMCEGSSEAKRMCTENVNFKYKEESLVKPGVKCKMKKRIIVGNISKWIPPEFRSDNASHKWTVYVRDSEKGDISKFVSKVRFFLHPSYKPNDVIELSSSPFHLSRHGWGEFPVRVQLHFVNNVDKPIDIIHNLKLDRTFTGLQTIGSETVVDIWISLKYIKETPASLNLQLLTEEQIKNVSKKSEKINDHIPPELSILRHDHDYASLINTNSSTKNNDMVEIKKNDPLVTDFEKANIENTIKNTPKNYTSQRNMVSILIPQNAREIKKYNLSNNIKYSNEKVIGIKSDNKIENCDSIYNLTKNLDTDNRKICLKYEKHINSLKNSLINLMQSEITPKSLFNILKFITHRVPLITEKSVDINYKMFHPYATESFQLFSSYSKGKQCSLERYRAVSVLNILKNTKKYSNNCSTKEFIIWARRYCYSPLLSIKDIDKNLCTLNDSQNRSKYKLSSTISEKVNNWLMESHKTDPKVCSKKETEEIIDILNTSKYTENSSISNSIKKNENKVIIMEYPNSQTSLNEFVSKTVQKLGIKFVNEEIILGVSHNTASVLMTKALSCLVDELVRLAFSCALDRCKDQTDSLTITTEDIRMALLRREDFEIFTNAGLGSEG